MVAKTEIVEQLGESAVLLPDLIADALAANDRAKLRLTLLQEAVATAAAPTRARRDLAAERRAAQLDDPAFDATVSGARALDDGQVAIPGAARLIAGLYADLDAMIAPVAVADPVAAAPFVQRRKALASGEAATADIMALAAVAALTSARRGASDGVHLLIMDLHKTINRVAERTAVETVAGAKAIGLTAPDRLRVQAFMRGLNRTAPLAFGHPGLASTAIRVGTRLTIQNDIGATDAHVIVVHVEGLTLDLTYTDVHRGRTRFFMEMFKGRGMDWSPLSEKTAEGLAEGGGFYLVTGRCQASDLPRLDALLEHLGSRLVFLIDWNKARKALQAFVAKRAAVSLLAEAAAGELGHRAFLALGGGELVLDAVRHAGAGQAAYGARLDEVLDPGEARAFLARTLRICSKGLAAGRSTRLMRDEIQAELARRLQTAGSQVLGVTLRHLGLSRMLAAEISNALSGTMVATLAERVALTGRATLIERKGDQLTLEAREIAGRLTEAGPGLRLVVDEAEEALDALDEAAFLFSLAPDGLDGAHLLAPLAALAAIVVESAGQMVRVCEAAICAPAGRQQDAADALQAIDAVCAAERAADAALRQVLVALMAAPPPDPRGPIIEVKLATVLEEATDHMAHSALALRDHLLKEPAQ